MTGSRFTRGRSGRWAIYGGCLIIFILLVFLYRAATSEMTKLRELHIQCIHQQEALAAQLQVIFEYKIRLEKSLAEEKSSNAMVKQELQKRANKEKSLRDKDSIEALQRFNSLQQQHKLLKSEHQDLTDECDKRQKLAMDENNRLVSILQDLRSQIRNKNKNDVDKDKMVDKLKGQYNYLENEKAKIENKYNQLMRNKSNDDQTISHLHEQIFQLKYDINILKSSCQISPTQANLLHSHSHHMDLKEDSVTQKVVPSLSSSSLLSSYQQETVATIPLKTINTSISPTQSLQDANTPGLPMKLASRLKLPLGVVPIPKMMDEKRMKHMKITPAERKPIHDIDSPLLKVESNDENLSKGKKKDIDSNISPNKVGRIETEHIGDNIFGDIDDKNDKNAAWILRVKPGFQEVGELNRNDKIPDLDHKQSQDIEEQDDDYREPQLGEEDPDEDDQIEDDQIK